jgi:hypothetical protein
VLGDLLVLHVVVEAHACDTPHSAPRSMEMPLVELADGEHDARTVRQASA